MARARIRLPIVSALLVVASLLISAPVFAVTYVVGPTGDDANTGTYEAPWRTIQYAVDQAGAGDTVLVQAGSYTESVHLGRGGAAGNPMVLAAAPGAVLLSPDPTASMEAIDVAPGLGYLTMTGIEATGGFAETIFLRSGAHDIRIAGCNLHHNRAGIIMEDAVGVAVERCVLHDNLTLGIRFAGTTHEVVVQDTDSFLNGSAGGCRPTVDGFAAEAQSADLTFVNTRALDNSGDGFDLQGTRMVLDGVESSGNACTGVKLWQSASVQNCLVTANGRGIGLTSWFGGTAVSIVNCTVAANDGVGLDLAYPLVAGGRYSVELLSSIVTGEYKAIQYVRAATLTESHNLLFRTSLYDPVIMLVNGRRFSGHDVNTGRWAKLSSQGEGTLAVDPLFVDAAHGDFHAQPVSAAVGRGQQTASGGVLANMGCYPEPEGPTNHAPAADAGRDRIGRVNRKLRFDASGSIDPDGDRLAHAWDFGDGSGAQAGLRVLHAYAAPGTYGVTLTASDGSLSGSTTIQVIVK